MESEEYMNRKQQEAEKCVSILISVDYHQYNHQYNPILLTLYRGQSSS